MQLAKLNKAQSVEGNTEHAGKDSYDHSKSLIMNHLVNPKISKMRT